jgi:hypothetical protein
MPSRARSGVGLFASDFPFGFAAGSGSRAPLSFLAWRVRAWPDFFHLRSGAPVGLCQFLFPLVVHQPALPPLLPHRFSFVSLGACPNRLELTISEAPFLFCSCFSHVGFTRLSSDLVRSTAAVRSGFDSHSVLLLNQVCFSCDLGSGFCFEFSILLFFVPGSPI